MTIKSLPRRGTGKGGRGHTSFNSVLYIKPQCIYSTGVKYCLLFASRERELYCRSKGIIIVILHEAIFYRKFSPFLNIVIVKERD